MEQIRVLVVDELPVFREGLLTMLRTVEGIEVVGDACGGLDDVEKMAEYCPNVVLAGLHQACSHVLEATGRIKKACPDAFVIVFTTSESDVFAAEALRAGVSGYLPEDVPKDLLIHTIRTVNKGGLLFKSNGRWGEEAPQDSRQARIGREQQADVSRSDAFVSFTPRQKEVLRLLVEGRTNKEIGEMLSMSKETAKKHVQCILFKLHACDRTQAAVKAVREGLVV